MLLYQRRLPAYFPGRTTAPQASVTQSDSQARQSRWTTLVARNARPLGVGLRNPLSAHGAAGGSLGGALFPRPSALRRSYPRPVREGPGVT